MLELASKFFVCLCPSDLCLTKSSTLWATAERLVQIYITGSGKHSPARTKTTTAHAVPRDWTVLVVLPGSQLLHPPRRLHSRKCRGNHFWGISLSDRICLCFVQGADAMSPSQAVPLLRGPQPSHWSQHISMETAVHHVKSWRCFWMCHDIRIQTCRPLSRTTQTQPNFSGGPEKLRGGTEMMQPLKMFGRLIWASLCIFLFIQGLRMWAMAGLRCRFKWGDAVPGRPHSASRLTANLLHDFTNHTVYQINAAALRATKMPKKASLNVWH